MLQARLREHRRNKRPENTALRFQSFGAVPMKTNGKIRDVAEGVGFEPTIRLRACRFSRPVYSTTLAPLQADGLGGFARSAAIPNG